jgi:hypothetical protein
MEGSLYRLSKYLENQDCSESASPVPYSLLTSLPSPYAATRVFGLELLNINGENAKIIRDLFCIRTYALEYGILPAIDLLCSRSGHSNAVQETSTFPRIYFECCNILPREYVHLALNLEKIRLCYELSLEIAKFKGSSVPNYTAKHYQNQCSFLYLREMCSIMEKIETFDTSPKFYQFAIRHLEYMLAHSSIATPYVLQERLNYREIIALTEASKTLKYLSRYVPFVYTV